MELFILKDGELVAATREQIFDPKITLYDEDGKALDRPEPEKEEEVEEKEDELSGLNETLTSLNTAITSLGEKFKTQEDEVKKLKVQAQKGFAIDNPDTVKYTENDNEVMNFLNKHFDRRRQGREWQQAAPGLVYPRANDEKTIDELYKYFALVNIASRKRVTQASMKALEMFEQLYGKTNVGDTGNVFPIPDIVEAEIIWFARERSYILQRGRVVNMISEKESWPRETSQATVYWGNTTQLSDPTVDEVELDAEELSCYSVVKNAHAADSRSDIVAWLTANLGEAAGLELDNKAFNGLGTDDPFICSGILSAACGNSVTLESGSTAFSQLSTTDLSEMIAALSGVRKTGARFMMHGAVLHFIRDLKDANGRPIFLDGSIGTGVPATIFGFPYDEVIKMPSTSGSNTAFMAFGNPAYFYVGRRLDSATLDVNPYLLWTTNRTAYKIYQRWALVIALPAAFVRLLTNST